MGDSTPVTVGWDDEVGLPWVEEGDHGDGEAQAFTVRIPTPLADRWYEARDRLRKVEAQIVDAAGYDPSEARMASCCPEWTGSDLPGVDFWAVRCGDRTVARFHSRAGADRLVDTVARLKDRHALVTVAWALDGPLVVDPDQTAVVHVPEPPQVSPCHRCGWNRDDHPKGARDEDR